MPTYSAPLKDYHFLLTHFLELEKYADIEGFAAAQELAEPLLAESAKLCEEVLFPLNRVGDMQGLQYKDGTVTTPDGFKEAYKAYVEGGWPTLTWPEQYGGQNMPEFLNMPMLEMVCSTNLAFGLTPGLTHGAISLLLRHGSEELKNAYLPKMVAGEWSGVMCLTEPGAGTDLGLIKTRAEPAGDGTYRVSGTKIFISAGEQDQTENIIHLVLARLPDAPKGVKGISLFLVPKYLSGGIPQTPDDSRLAMEGYASSQQGLAVHPLPSGEGRGEGDVRAELTAPSPNLSPDGGEGRPHTPLGDRNHFSCGSIEHKMGIHASPTCVMNYDGAVGYLVGEPHRGLAAMFTMMNAARLYVGVQGLGVAEAAYQNALSYAKERLQGRALTGVKYPEKPADPITVHPDVRRMLYHCKSNIEAARALALWVARESDIAHRHPDAKTREAADDLVQLMTPILKSTLTDMGFDVASTAMQVFGGYGYIEEYGASQYLRDARIAMIYEGTNGVQAMDLVGRKLGYETGRYLSRFFIPVDDFVAAQQNNPAMQEFIKPLAKHLKYLQQATMYIATMGLSNPNHAGAGAVEYQKLFSLVVFAYLLAKQAEIALKLRDSDPEFFDAKLATARYFFAKELPYTTGLLASITAGAEVVMAEGL